MSRSALERREQLLVRKQQQEFQPNLEEEREVKNNELKIHGNQTTYNMNQLLANNIYACDYFKALYQLKTYHEVIDEIYNRVTNAEPWATGTARLPSTAFCLLFKFFTMRLTRKQIYGLLNHQDSPYIRCIGFLYLRYVCDPKELWTWFSPYIDDPEEFPAGSDPNDKTTMGVWVVKLMTELQYFGTLLPRIPVPIERKIKMRLVLQEEKRKRAKVNRRMMHAFRPGAKVKAIYEDEDNDPAWYDAVIDTVEEDEQYGVTFPAYGNQELVGLGDLMLPQGAGGGGGGAKPASRERSRSRSPEARRRSRSRSRERSRKGRRSRSRSRSRSRDRRRRDDRGGRGGRSPDGHEEGSDGGGGYGDSLLMGKNLMEAVMKREREASAAVGKDYAQRPASYKGSLSLQMDRFTHRKKSRSRSPPDTKSSSSRRRSPSPASRRSPPAEEEKRKERVVESEKMKKLKDMYGDASSKPEER